MRIERLLWECDGRPQGPTDAHKGQYSLMKKTFLSGYTTQQENAHFQKRRHWRWGRHGRPQGATLLYFFVLRACSIPSLYSRVAPCRRPLVPFLGSYSPIVPLFCHYALSGPGNG